jgi:hypothetical protein
MRRTPSADTIRTKGPTPFMVPKKISASRIGPATSIIQRMSGRDAANGWQKMIIVAIIIRHGVDQRMIARLNTAEEANNAPVAICIKLTALG